MTWDHLQQLRAQARQRISAGLAALPPRGGAGCFVSGNVIGLEPAPSAPPPAAEETWLMGIWIAVAYVEVGADADGKLRTDAGEWDWEQAAAWTRPNTLLHSTYAHEKTAFWNNPPQGESRAWSRRDVHVRFRALAYERGRGPVLQPAAGLPPKGRHRFPVELTLDYVDVTIGHDHGVVGQTTLRIGRQGASFSPRPLAPHAFCQLRISGIRRA